MMNISTPTPRIVRELVTFFEQYPDCTITALAARSGVAKSSISMLVRREQADIRSADADALRCAMADVRYDQAIRKANKKS